MTSVDRSSLLLDASAEIERITTGMRRALAAEAHRRGLVVALSGGIDSSVVGALCVRSVGPERVFGLLMPERDSSEETRQTSREMARSLRIEHREEEITPILEACGCYERRDDAIRRAIPGYGAGWTSKIVLPSIVDGARLRIFSVVARSPDGREHRARLDHEAYLGVVAATNFKQRTRKMLEYHHADRLHFAVTGTANRLEHELGFFVKCGDGAADLKPIAHLYKTQVYQLAEALGVPERIRARAPTTDTYSMPQSQEEFYFSLPHEAMDLCLYGYDHGAAPADLAPALGLEAGQVDRVFRDIEAKRAATRYLRMEWSLS